MLGLIIGLLLGGFIGTATMCLLQIYHFRGEGDILAAKDEEIAKLKSVLAVTDGCLKAAWGMYVRAESLANKPKAELELEENHD